MNYDIILILFNTIKTGDNVINNLLKYFTGETINRNCKNLYLSDPNDVIVVVSSLEISSNEICKYASFRSI